ncbi:hypothetical protein D3C85_1567760 [compost metagenome]
MVKNPLDQPRITIAMALVQVLGIEKRANLARRPRQRRQTLLAGPAQQLAPHRPIDDGSAVPETVAGQPAIERALGLTVPGVEVGIEQGIGLRVGPGRRGQGRS